MQAVALLASQAARRYGAFPSKHDGRDFMLPATYRMSSRPARVDLSEFLGPVKDQGTLGACTGFGAAGQMEFLYRKYAVPSEQSVFSPLNIYWNERDIEGDLDSDGGAQIRTACQVITSRGACAEISDPYHPSDFRTAPTPLQIAAALEHRAGAYHRLSGLLDMLACLASGYTFMMGFLVYGSFEGIGSSGIMPVPVRGDIQLGGHCVLVYGYDDTTRELMVRNSWGAGWGKGGNFLMPYEVAQNLACVFDAWVCHLGRPW